MNRSLSSELEKSYQLRSNYYKDVKLTDLIESLVVVQEEFVVEMLPYIIVEIYLNYDDTSLKDSLEFFSYTLDGFCEENFSFCRSILSSAPTWLIEEILKILEFIKYVRAIDYGLDELNSSITYWKVNNTGQP